MRKLANVHPKIIVLAAALCVTPICKGGMIELADAAFFTLDESNYKSKPDLGTLGNGQFWEAPEGPSSIPGPGLPSRGNLSNLTLNFGSGPITGMMFNFYQTGRVEFLNASGVATGDYIEPFGLSGGYSTIYANAAFTNGLLDPIYLNATRFPQGDFDPANGLQAFRFNWPSNCPNSQINTGPGPALCASNGFLTFQALLIEIDEQDFQLQFNYQNSASSLPSDRTQVGSFKLGDNVGSYSGPFLSTGPNFCFHNGLLVDCDQIASVVPEPGTAPLMGLGALIVGISVARGRRRRVVS